MKTTLRVGNIEREAGLAKWMKAVLGKLRAGSGGTDGWRRRVGDGEGDVGWGGRLENHQHDGNKVRRANPAEGVKIERG